MSDAPAFWETKRLADMSEDEWEKLCDGCGKCCLHKLEDEDSGEIHFTNVACRMLDLKTIRCRRYDERRRFVATCVKLSPNKEETFRWMPGSCAYRRLVEGRGLPAWHPLITGSASSVHTAGVSVRGRAVDERLAGDFEDHLVADIEAMPTLPTTNQAAPSPNLAEGG